MCYLGALLITKGETAAGTPVRSVVDGRVAAQAEGSVPLFRAADDRLFAEDDVARFQIPRRHHVPGQDQAKHSHQLQQWATYRDDVAHFLQLALSKWKVDQPKIGN